MGKEKIYFVTADQLEKFSGSMIRAKGIIEALIDSNYQVKHGFFSEGKTKDVLEDVRQKAPGFFWERVNWPSIFDSDVIWLSHFWSNNVLIGALRIVDQVRRLKPQIRLVVDLCDVILSNNSMLSEQERRITAYLESILLHSADCVVYVSESEAFKGEKYYGLEKNKIVSIPIPFFPQAALLNKGFKDRPYELCMAGSTHPHNQRAFNYALESVWPLIASNSPQAEIHIFGQHTDKLIFKAKSDGTYGGRIRQFGEVPNLQEKLSEYKMQLVTTVTGSGVKTKILDCLATGTPVVGTSRSVEGMDLHDTVGVFISDDPKELADWCKRLAKDEEFWSLAHCGIKAHALKMSQTDSVKSQSIKAIDIALSSPNIELDSAFNREKNILLFSPSKNSSVMELQKLLNSSEEFQVYEGPSCIVSAFSKNFWIYQDLIVSSANEESRKEHKIPESVHFLSNLEIPATKRYLLKKYKASYELIASGFDELCRPDGLGSRMIRLESDVETMSSMLALTSHYRNSTFLVIFGDPLDQWLSLHSCGDDFESSLAKRPETFLCEYARIANLYIEFFSIRPARTVFVEDRRLADMEFRRKVAKFCNVKISNAFPFNELIFDSAGVEVPHLIRNIFEGSEAQSAYEKMKALSTKEDAMINLM